MKEKLEAISKMSKEKIAEIKDSQALNDFKVKVLGKKGELTEILRGMKDIAAEERPVVGNLVNKIRDEIEQMIDEKESEFKNKDLQERLEKEKIDVTLPATKVKRGSEHPLNRVIEEVEDLFVSMGYDVVSGPELETDEYCFERANIPKDHPARDMQDSLYIDPNRLLRTHTTAIQMVVLEESAPNLPIKVVCPGKVYRRDDDDATHSHQFMQMEGLVIGEKVTLADLKGTLEFMARKLFGQDRQIRFRPSYFPFTEPSAEMDISCNICGGKGCPFCKHTGWVEILGCGMVDPNVLESNGIDSKVYSGYALGMGIERITNLKYQVKDLRMFSENDTRFLKEFESAY